MYIEQTDKSSNKSPGLSGYTLQAGGSTSSFVLQTAVINELVPHPWNWIFVLNYHHENVGGDRKAYSGYWVSFLTAPNVSGTVIIYDR